MSPTILKGNGIDVWRNLDTKTNSLKERKKILKELYQGINFSI